MLAQPGALLGPDAVSGHGRDRGRVEGHPAGGVGLGVLLHQPGVAEDVPREIHTDRLSRSGHRSAINSLRRAPVAAASRM